MTNLSPQQRAELLLRKYEAEQYKNFHLDDILLGESLFVEETETDDYLGKIVFSQNFGIITLNSKSKDKKQRRFTLAHEAGHFFNERHLLRQEKKTYQCTEQDLLGITLMPGREAEANKFAASLLMYEPWVHEITAKQRFNFSLLLTLARELKVSLTAAAIRYTEVGAVPSAVIQSKNGVVEWCAVHLSFPFHRLAIGERLPERSVAHSIAELLKKGYTSSMFKLMYGGFYRPKKLPYEFWNNSKTREEGIFYYEQNMPMPNYKAVLTLLWERKVKSMRNVNRKLSQI